MIVTDIICTVFVVGLVLYICKNTTFTFNYTTPNINKHEKIINKISKLESKLEHVETIHGYTSVTSLLKYEIEQLKTQLSETSTNS